MWMRCPVLGVVLHALKTHRYNIPTRNNVLHQQQKKHKFLTVGKEDRLLGIHYSIGKRIVTQLVLPTTIVPNVLRLKYDDASYMGTGKTT